MLRLMVVITQSTLHSKGGGGVIYDGHRLRDGRLALPIVEQK